MNVDTLNFKTLPISERIGLVAAIGDSFAEDTATKPIFVAEDVAEFHRRLAAHQADPCSSVAWDEVRAQLLKASH